MQKIRLCLFALYGNRIPGRDVASGNDPIQVQQPLATGIWKGFAERAVNISSYKHHSFLDP